MKKSTLIGLVLLTAGAIYVLMRRNKKTSVKIEEKLSVEIPNKTSRNLTEKELATIDRLNYGLPMTIDEFKVKQPLRVKPKNLIPDVYGRTSYMNFEGSVVSNGFYHNLSGLNTQSISNACKCSPNGVTLKSDIPKLP